MTGSVLVLSTGHTIPVEPDPERSHENLRALIDNGEEWAFSTITGAWFQVRAIVAILPGEPVPKKRAPSAKKAAARG